MSIENIQGLTSSEAKQALLEHGYNEIKTQEESWGSRLFKRFWGPIPWMIEVAGILSAVAQRWEDFIIIMVMLLVNAFVDFYQESKALNAIAVLKRKLAPLAMVIRDGVLQEIPAKELVPNDIIKIKIGDIVPADVRLLGGSDFLQLDMSALTGESLPVNKKVNDEIYGNAIVKQGEMIAKVTKTGIETYFGKTVGLVAKAQSEEKSHFQKMVLKVGDFLILLTLLMIAIIIAFGIYRGEDIVELLIFALVLTISAIPVAMPAVLTVTMALGARVLATKNAIVSRLASIEELAGMDILCSDKTGTLTQNIMSLAEPYVVDGYSKDKLMLYAKLASKKENNDPIEKPILEYIDEFNLTYPDNKLEKFIPFDPIRKRTEAIYQDGTSYIKGAPQIIIEICKDDDTNKTKAYEMVEKFAGNGFRTLGVAYKNRDDREYSFVGLIPLFDPPREDSKEAIALANQNGIEVKMVTGDNVSVAIYISKILGIGKNIQSIKELKGENTKEYIYLTQIIGEAITKTLQPNISQQEIDQKVERIVKEVRRELDNRPIPLGAVKKHESEIIKIIEHADGFAEVFPEDKFFIVDELQKADHIIGMTGDGVNDAPALKKADCGIAVSGATEAARASADIVLISSGLKVIIDAIEQSRIIFERMKSYVIFRIAESIRIIIFMSLSIVVFNFYPISAIMIIILALLNDIPIMTIAYDNTKMNKQPVRWDMKEVFILSSWLGIAGVMSSFLIFYIMMVFFKSHPNGIVIISWLPDWISWLSNYFPNGIKMFPDFQNWMSWLSNYFSNGIKIFPDLPNWIDIKDNSNWISFVQSLFFAKLVIAGHGTIYNTRISDWFFKKPYPSLILFLATFSTGIIGTIIAVYGFGLITPIGWDWAIFMWIYALGWFIFNDIIKMVVLRYYRKKYKENIL